MKRPASTAGNIWQRCSSPGSVSEIFAKYLWNTCKILFEIFFLNICETAGLSDQSHLAKNQFWKKFCLVNKRTNNAPNIARKMYVNDYKAGCLAKVCFKRVCWLQRMSYKPTHKEGTPPSYPIECGTWHNLVPPTTLIFSNTAKTFSYSLVVNLGTWLEKYCNNHTSGVHLSFDVLRSWADQWSCAHKCVC